MKSHDEIHLILSAGGGIIARHDHPELRATLDGLLRSGRLVSVLPGIYARPEVAGDRAVRLRAAARRHPNGVLLNGAAARLTYWPEAPLQQIEMAVPETVRNRPGFVFTRRIVPPE